MKVQILTQDNCTKCNSLKTFLDRGLGGRYNDKIEWVKREDNPEMFMTLAENHNVMATPTVIYGDQIMRNPNPNTINDFLKQVE